MLIYAGIDEAGYGPMFGPLTVAMTVFVLDEHDPASGAPDLWKLLRRAVHRSITGAKGRLVVADSKKLTLAQSDRRHRLTHLEPSVLAFTRCMDGCAGDSHPDDDLSFARLTQCEIDSALERCRWYAGESVPLPCAGDESKLAICANVLRQSLKKAGIRFLQPCCHALCEDDFNARVACTRSKAATSFALVGQHLNHVLTQWGQHHPRIIVDRQGGRTHYREPLQLLFPDASIRIVAERDTLARYDLTIGDRSMTVSFAQGAEELHFPVALASMIAKYQRELMMARLNRYFQTLMPEIKPTAGYVQDGRRFLSEIKPVLKQAGIAQRDLVRTC